MTTDKRKMTNGKSHWSFISQARFHLAEVDYNYYSSVLRNGGFKRIPLRKNTTRRRIMTEIQRAHFLLTIIDETCTFSDDRRCIKSKNTLTPRLVTHL